MFWEITLQDIGVKYIAVVESPTEAVAKNRAYAQIAQQYRKSVHDCKAMTYKLCRTSSYTPNTLPVKSLKLIVASGIDGAKRIVESARKQELPYYYPPRVPMFKYWVDEHEEEHALLLLVDAIDVAQYVKDRYVLAGNVTNACRLLEIPNGEKIPVPND